MKSKVKAAGFAVLSILLLAMASLRLFSSGDNWWHGFISLAFSAYFLLMAFGHSRVRD